LPHSVGKVKDKRRTSQQPDERNNVQGGVTNDFLAIYARGATELEYAFFIERFLDVIACRY